MILSNARTPRLFRVLIKLSSLSDLSLTLVQQLLRMVMLCRFAPKILQLALFVLYLFWTLIRQTGQLTVRS